MNLLVKTIFCIAVLYSAPIFCFGKIPTVYLSKQAGIVEQYAGKELCKVLKKVFGEKSQLVMTDTLPKSEGIILGSIESNSIIKNYAEKFKLAGRNAKDDVIALYTINNHLYLAGNTPRAVLYAVYFYLQHELGVRRLWPGKKGEFITRRHKWQIPELAMTYVSPFRIRSINPIRAKNRETEVWMARNFINCGATCPGIRDEAGFERMLGGHYIALEKDDYEKYPELFAMTNGKRTPDGIAGCWSNPNFTKVILPRLIARIRKRNANMVNLFPADTTLRCECTECKKNPDASSRWYNYYTKLQKELKKTFPKLRFFGLAYQEYRKVPASGVHGLEAIQYCHYNRCYSHRLEDSNCPINLQTLREIKAWNKKVPVGIYGYEFCMLKGYEKLYLPFWSMLHDQFQVYRKMKLPWVHVEMMLARGKTRPESAREIYRLANYIYLRLAWNPGLTIDKILNDFCQTVYGPAAASMLGYHLKMGKAWDGLKQHVTYGAITGRGLAGYMFTRDNIQSLRISLEDAEKQIREKAPTKTGKRYLENLKVDKALLRKWIDKFNLVGKKQYIAVRMKSALSKLTPLLPKSQKGGHQKTIFKVYRTKEAFHLQAVCFDANIKNLVRGTNKRDQWEFPNSIELFLDLNDGSAYRHFSITPGGGKYDAAEKDSTWNAEWSAAVKFFKDRWEVDVAIPFSSLGLTAPPHDKLWNLTVVRNGNRGSESCGFPNACWHEIWNGASIYFPEKSTNARSLHWIFPAAKNLNQRSPGKVFESINYYIPSLMKSGWSFSSSTATERLKESVRKVIVINTFKNKLPRCYFKKEILPHVDKGALLVFNCYGNLPLARYLGSNDWKVCFTEKLESNEMKFCDTFKGAPVFKKDYALCAYIPEHPSKWQILAKVKTKNNEYVPVILAAKYGKGLIIVTTNITYRKKVDRSIEYLNSFLRYQVYRKRF